MVPASYKKTAERFLYEPEKAFAYFDELLKRHPDPSSLLNYLNERRFVLLVMILEQSACLRKFLFRHPTEFQNAIPNLWYKVKEKEDYLKELEEVTATGSFSEKLAFYRHRELMRIFAKELLGVSSYEDLLREYSYLPDAMLELAFRKAWNETVERFGEPKEEDGSPATAAVVALGKLGSEELNYYSDVDLLFIHSSDKGSAGKVSLPEFFAQLFKRLVELVNARTPEGVPYEVDLDLRPFGKSGPISMSLRSAELYYESYGRVWERFALLRARFSAGDEELYRRFEKEVVTPFVFSSADFKLIEEIRLMKKKIEAEARKGFLKGFNVKTGEGGIREVEFGVQSLVILLGSKNPFLRESNTYRAIYKLHHRGVFSAEEAELLEKAYTFLRKLEHRIQLKDCIRTQVLKEEDKERLARYLGYETKAAFEADLSFWRKTVRTIFNQILPEAQKEPLDELQEALMAEDREKGQKLLKEKGFKDALRAFLALSEPLFGERAGEFSEKEKKAYLKLVPLLVELSARSPSPDETLKNFFKFFYNPTGKRVVLSEHKKEEFLEKLFLVFSLSPYLSHLIARNPDLVEDALTLYRDFPTKRDYAREFARYKETLSLTPENLYRRFKTVWEVRIGLVYFLKEEEPNEKLKKLFTSLSELAEFILESLWQELSLASERGALFSLGKLGSRELTFGSDLDLVFCAYSTQDKPSLYEKAKKLVRFLTAHTAEGYLYSVDFRLRPMGSKGELVPELEFYRKYFQKEARTWERLAWVRSRFITGHEETAQLLEQEIRNFLFNKPWGEKERKEVYEMRLKLQSAAKKGKGVVDLKLGEGGIVDGEFLVQYLLIKHKVRESSMIKGFERMLELYPELKDAYEAFLFLRRVETHLRLSKERGTSVLTPQDLPRVALSMGLEPETFEKELKRKMKALRRAFEEFLAPQ
ncbi:MAG: glutamine-synthetase adenylyltransferase [Aquificae bacterium]|nr:glutamine-synthetase adenylyltransferase [Aquificota bacterium]